MSEDVGVLAGVVLGTGMRLRSRRTRLIALGLAAGLGVPTAVMAGTGTSALGQQPRHKIDMPTSKQRWAASHEHEGKQYVNARQRYLESRYLSGTHPISPERAGMYRAA